MSKQTTPEQRRMFYKAHQAGRTYQEIADRYAVSKECIRYWCRRQRDGGSCETVYRRPVAGILSRFDPKVRYAILRLRLEHPRWGPERIRHHLSKRPSLRELRLPSRARIGRYLHQWPRFRRPLKIKRPVIQRPNPATVVHQRWQLDFKIRIPLADGTMVHLHTAYDPVGAACIGAAVFLTGQRSRHQRIRLENVQAFLRTCFSRWQTLPQEIQTDGETVLIGKPDEEAFPSRFTLWLRGLGIEHLIIRPGKPTDNAEVERCHRTINEYALVGNETASASRLQSILNQALDDLLFELPSRAKDCRGKPPALAHPELFHPPRPFCQQHELACFDLSRVDQYLATFTWIRRVGSNACVRLNTDRYHIGASFVGRDIYIRFDPVDRNFVFSDTEAPEKPLKRWPAKALTVYDLTGIAEWPFGLGLQQLPLPLTFAEG